MDLFSNRSSCRTGQFLIAMAFFIALIQSAWAQTFPSSYTNLGSIANTRHNLSMFGTTGVGPSGTVPPALIHNKGARNQYEEVCVYCHTPHGANQTAKAPLWNRTIKITNYFTYNELGTSSLTQEVSDTPGGASLTCLSCHDGQTAIDSIINMPGSGIGMPGAPQHGAGLVSQEITQNNGFLNSWNNRNGAADTITHRGINSSGTSSGSTSANPGTTLLGDGTGFDGIGCMTCHSPVGAASSIIEANDMRLFNIGTDLRNDHPIGITFPVLNGPGTDFNKPLGTKVASGGVGESLYFDVNGNGKMEKGEIRTYDGKVECASCHDPHGVPSAGPGTIFNKTFLRVQNTNGSAVCLTCHIK